jgi:sugar lactone lactonase YvrE
MEPVQPIEQNLDSCRTAAGPDTMVRPTFHVSGMDLRLDLFRLAGMTEPLTGWIREGKHMADDKIRAVACVAATGDRCGEGAVWHPGEQAVYWTDINRFLIHRYSLEWRSVKTWFFEQPVTALTLTNRDDTLAVVLGSGVILWEPAADRRSAHLFHLPGWPLVRCNDARVDPEGRLWIGTMRNNVGEDGAPGEAGGTDGILYRVDPDGAVSEWQHGVSIANTLAWSPDRTIFYFADSPLNRISRYQYDASGQIGEERSFFEGFARGLPDGSDMDSDGYLWNCRYGGSCLVRVAPSGKLDRVIEMPVQNPTTCIFGGRDRTTLFVTSAALDAAPSDRLGGCLFSIETIVQGLIPNRFHVFSRDK